MDVVDVFDEPSEVPTVLVDAVAESTEQEPVYEDIPETTGVRTVVETLDSASA
jgi:hypothetical protein